MPDSALNGIVERADRLAELVDKESYTDALTELEQLDAAIRSLNKDQISNLDQEEQQYLYQLAKWLTDQDGDMQARSKRLVDIITPFNKNSALKSNKHYRDHGPNG